MAGLQLIGGGGVGAGAFVNKGSIDCSANPNYPAADNAHLYTVTVAGKIGGASGKSVTEGDTLYCIKDGSASDTQAKVGANWVVVPGVNDGATGAAGGDLAGTYPNPTLTKVAKVFNVKDYGAKGDGKTDDTAAIQAASDAAGAGGQDTAGDCYLPSGTYMFSNLTLWAYMKFRGAHMDSTHLKRIVGSTGTAIREKTAGEGNTNGANDLWVSDFQLDGNGTAGDGLVLGYGATTLQNRSSVDNVFSWGFPSGTGINLNTNAVRIGWIWAASNKVGIYTNGSGSSYFGVWSENNSEYDLDIHSFQDSFFGTQIETGAKSSNLINVAGYATFYGVYVGLSGDVKNVLSVLAGGNDVSVHGLRISDNGHKFDHGCYSADHSAGTGTTLWIPSWYYTSGKAVINMNAASGTVVTLP